MKLQDFIIWQIARLEDFEQKWSDQSIKDSDQYPLDQEIGIWFERLYWFNANSSDLSDTGLND